jgi:hypothetical protein
MSRAEPTALGADILERALDPLAGASPEAVAELITMAGGLRAPLEAAASLLIARLHRASDDFRATTALCSVTLALSRIGWEMPPPPTRHQRWTWG